MLAIDCLPYIALIQIPVSCTSQQAFNFSARGLICSPCLALEISVQFEVECIKAFTTVELLSLFCRFVMLCCFVRI